jgi:hypothetical protein
MVNGGQRRAALKGAEVAEHRRVTKFYAAVTDKGCFGWAEEGWRASEIRLNPPAEATAR